MIYVYRDLTPGASNFEFVRCSVGTAKMHDDKSADPFSGRACGISSILSPILDLMLQASGPQAQTF